MHTLYTDRHLRHDPNEILNRLNPYESAEIPARAEIIRAAIAGADLGPISPPVDHGLDPILAVHDRGLIDFLQTAYQRVTEFHGAPSPAVPDTFATRLAAPRRTRSVWGQLGYYCIGVGSPILAGTWEAAYWSAQCALTAADYLAAHSGGLTPVASAGLEAQERGVRSVYSLSRPPGHHAGRDFYGGFCYLNNAAIVTRYLQLSPQQSGKGSVRVALLDFDYHHGNGTQAIFYDDPAVLFCSLHADPDDEYPYYWGYADERGAGPGEGFTRNFPLPLGTQDDLYLDTLMQALEAIREFDPRYLVVSAGFDIFTGDPVGGFKVTTDGIARLGQAVAALSLPTVIIQEGGYLRENLGENAVAFLSQFEGK